MTHEHRADTDLTYIYGVYSYSMMMSANVRALYLPTYKYCKPLQLMPDIRVPIIYYKYIIIQCVL